MIKFKSCPLGIILRQQDILRLLVVILKDQDIVFRRDNILREQDILKALNSLYHISLLKDNMLFS